MPNPPSCPAANIDYVILYVNDMNRALAFYRDVLGLGVRAESPEWSELETKGTTLALHRTDEKAAPVAANVPRVVLSGSDVRAAHATLRDRKVEITDLKPVWESPEVVGISGDFQDPDGNHLSVYGVIPAKEWAAGK